MAFGEALQPEFKEYQQQLVKNCAVLAEELMKQGLKLVSGGTDNHLLLLDLRDEGVSGAELETRLDEVHITTNKNKIPNDPRSARETSGLRLGTAAVTARGFKEPELRRVAELIAMAVKDFEGKKAEIAKGTAELCERFPLY